MRDVRFRNFWEIARTTGIVFLILQLSGCASLMTEQTQTVRLKTQPPGRIVYFQDRPVRDGAYVTVQRDFEAPLFEIREGARRIESEMEYKAEPWIIGDAVLLIPFILPGVIAGGLDIGTGAWRKLDDPQVLALDEILAAADAEANPGNEESESKATSAPSRAQSPSPSSVDSAPEDPASKKSESTPKPDPRPVPKSSTRITIPPPQEGIVSWYDPKEAGHRTASGAPFDPEAMAAAHRTLPFGTKVRVTRLDTLYSVVVTINDRGPSVEGRMIDLTRRPAEKLGLPDVGIAPCRIEVIEMPAQ